MSEATNIGQAREVDPRLGSTSLNLTALLTRVEPQSSLHAPTAWLLPGSNA